MPFAAMRVHYIILHEIGIKVPRNLSFSDSFATSVKMSSNYALILLLSTLTFAHNADAFSHSRFDSLVRMHRVVVSKCFLRTIVFKQRDEAHEQSENSVDRASLELGLVSILLVDALT